MRIIKIIILIPLLVATLLEAQSPARQATVQALKVAFLTKDLNLTADEAQKFWPVYNTYIDELKKTKKDSKEDVLAFEERALAIKKKYSIDFKRILASDERANKVFLSDRNFAMFIKKELQDRQRLRSMRQGFGDMDRNNKPTQPQTDN
ncbi:hypothetical protein [Parasediminibacterium sp. JCM 36343]|uniref:hypothetical protein n=1 Tax=Parasediminibacterium sp. JCM 36343 TaxID=3374279 RepID=UPI00397A717A